MRSTDSLQKPSSSGHVLDKVQLLAIGASNTSQHRQLVTLAVSNSWRENVSGHMLSFDC